MKESLSQRKLLEILTREIEILRKTSSNIHEVAPIIEERLQELKRTKLIAHVDIQELKSLINEHESFVKSRTVIPSWFIIAFLILVCIITIQSIWLYAHLFG